MLSWLHPGIPDISSVLHETVRHAKLENHVKENKHHSKIFKIKKDGTIEIDLLAHLMARLDQIQWPLQKNITSQILPVKEPHSAEQPPLPCISNRKPNSRE